MTTTTTAPIARFGYKAGRPRKYPEGAEKAYHQAGLRISPLRFEAVRTHLELERGVSITDREVREFISDYVYEWLDSFI